MAARNKPYEQFGPFILFKKLEADALGDLWRAAAIEKGQLGPTVALRRLTGGNREAMSSNALAVAQVLPQISGSSFVRAQTAGVIDGAPYLVWEYGGGRSLRHIIDRARGSKDVQANPLPIDQALVIAERVALSLSTMAELRDTTGARLSHGALVPHFIWINDDGEIRVAGQQFGPGMLAALSESRVAAEVGRYFSPEYRASGQTQKNADVYSMGAILFLLVTGQEPPDAMTASAFMAAVRAGKTMAGTPIPDDIRVILDKSFNLDASMRYASVADMKQALSALTSSGRYSATTFNLAFYLSTLLKKEMEAETAEREAEGKVSVAAYLAAPQPVTASAPAPVPTAPQNAATVLSAPEKTRSKAPLAIAAAVVVAVLGGGAYMMLGRTASQPAATQVVAAQTLPVTPAPAQQAMPEPIAVSATPQTDTAATATAAATSTVSDAEAQKRAFEEAVRQRMQAEMMKLQNDFMADLKAKQSKDAPVASAPPPPAVASSAPAQEERPAVTAAQLDTQRRQEQAAEATTRTAAPPIPAPAVATQTVAPQQTAPAPAPAPAQVTKAAVREGDVVDFNALDAMPRATRLVRPVYPPLAARQKIAATIFLTVFVDENGEVDDVRILRGDPRFGLNEAASRAMKATRFSSPMKDGKRVKTWIPQTIEFKP